QNQEIGPLGRNQVGQEWRVWRTQVTAEHDALATCLRGAELQLDISRTQYVTGWLQAHLAHSFVGFVQREPVAVGQGDDAFLHYPKVALQQCLIAADGKTEGVLEDNGQQLSGWLAAQDGSFEARGEQVRNASDMVNVDMGHNQRLDAFDGK